jgi:hypothetical protein
LVSDETYAEYNACRREAIELLAFTRKEFTIPNALSSAALGVPAVICVSPDFLHVKIKPAVINILSPSVYITSRRWYKPMVIGVEDSKTRN